MKGRVGRERWLTRVMMLNIGVLAVTCSACTHAPKEAANAADKHSVALVPDKLFDSEQCGERLVFCLDVEGNPLNRVETAPYVVPEEVLKIKVIGVSSHGENVRVTANENINNDSFAKPLPEIKAGDKSKPKPLFVPRFRVIAEASIAVTSKMQDILVQAFRRDDQSSPFERIAVHTLNVRHGRYFVDVGLMVPIVFDGQREIKATMLPGSSDRVVSEVSDTMIGTAVALNVYPMGHLKNDFAPRLHTLKHWWGLQVGIDLNIATPRQAYLGLLVEPVAGVALGGGLALVKSVRLPDLYQPGMLLGPGESLPTQDTILFQPYIGVTLSTEAIDLIRNGATKFAGSP